MSRNFKSDNVTPACDAIMAAVNAANRGSVPSYGGDEFTQKLQTVASEVFGTEVAIFPVTTGTAANALALSQYHAALRRGVLPRSGAHRHRRMRRAGVLHGRRQDCWDCAAADGKIGPDKWKSAIAFAEDMGVHHVKPAALSLTQATEWGTVYALAEVSALDRRWPSGTACRCTWTARDLPTPWCILGCTPADATWKMRRRRAVARRHQERRAVRRGRGVLRSGPSARFRAPPQARGTSVVEAAIRERPTAGVLRSRPVARQRRATRMRWRRPWRGAWQHVPAPHCCNPSTPTKCSSRCPKPVVAALEGRDSASTAGRCVPHRDGVAIRLVTSYATPRAHVDEFLAAVQAVSRAAACAQPTPAMHVDTRVVGLQGAVSRVARRRDRARGRRGHADRFGRACRSRRGGGSGLRRRDRPAAVRADRSGAPGHRSGSAEPHRLRRLSRRCCRTGGARNAVDCALWDLTAKQRRIPYGNWRASESPAAHHVDDVGNRHRRGRGRGCAPLRATGR